MDLTFIAAALLVGVMIGLMVPVLYGKLLPRQSKPITSLNMWNSGAAAVVPWTIVREPEAIVVSRGSEAYKFSPNTTDAALVAHAADITRQMTGARN